MSNPNDKVYTPEFVVDECLDILRPLINYEEVLLEPFKGDGAFYNKFNTLTNGNTYWCEIDDGVDFFNFNKRVDWIITNPPYSSFDKVLSKCLEVADNVALVIPTNKILSAMPRLMDIQRYGFNIKFIHYLGSGRQLKFPFGFAVGLVYIEKGYTDGMKITYSDRCYDSKRKKTK